MKYHDYAQEIENIIKLQDREEAYYKLATFYINGPEQARKQIRKDWDYSVEWIFPDQRRLACSKNEKRSCHERISASLVYDAIENLQDIDIRDKLVALSVIYHCCIEAGLDPREEFESIASISSRKVAKYLREFIQRKPEDKSKDAFMLKTEKNSDGETEISPSWM